MWQAGRLILLRAGQQQQEFALPEGAVTIGRAEVNDVVLHDETVSRAHARLECAEGSWTLHDLGSANGSRVNDVRVHKAKLKAGDIISIGDSTLRFESTESRAVPAVTKIASLEELDETLAEASLPISLSNTRDPRLVVYRPGHTQEAPLAEETLTLGRDPDSNVVLDDAEASRNHARIERRGRDFVFRDLGSTNGTWLGHERIGEHELQDGDALRIGHTRLIFKKGFAPEELTVVEPPLSGRKIEKRPIVFLPGIMGSELWHGSERLWPNLKRTFAHPEGLALPETKPLQARAVVNEVVVVPNVIKLARYNRLGNYLEEELNYERGKNLLEFAYDWRQDNRVSARRLAAAIEEWQKRNKEAARPITIIAHSMGSLVSRYYVERLGGKDKVERLIFLGGPHYGAPEMITTLLHGPKLLPFGLLGEKLRQMSMTFPSMYQLLPSYTCVVDQEKSRINVLAHEAWLREEQRPLLRNARAFHQELGVRTSIPSISIFGYGLKTITGASVQTSAEAGWHKADFEVLPSGDGTVPETSAVLDGSEIHPVRQYHGSLYTDNDVLMRLKVVLTKGVGAGTR